MVTASSTEVNVAVESLEEHLTTLIREINKLFVIMGDTTESLQDHYDNACKKIQEVEDFLKLEARYPKAFRPLFEKLEARCLIAKDREKRVISRNKHLKLS